MTGRRGAVARPGRRPRRRTAVAAGAVLAAVALAGCSSDGTTGGGGDQGFVSGDRTITLVPAGDRKEPIALSGNTLEGAPLDLATLRGKVVVLNVWGSWCAPCRAEAPDLEKAYGELKGSGVEFVGVNTQEQSPANALAFQRKFDVSYPSLADDGGRSLLALRGAVSAKAIPSTLVLDQQGRIAARVSGPTTAATLTDLVEDVVAGRDPKLS